MAGLTETKPSRKLDLMTPEQARMLLAKNDMAFQNDDSYSRALREIAAGKRPISLSEAISKFEQATNPNSISRSIPLMTGRVRYDRSRTSGR